MKGGEFVEQISRLQYDNGLTNAEVASALAGIVVVLCAHTGNDPVSLIRWAVQEAGVGPSRPSPWRE